MHPTHAISPSTAQVITRICAVVFLALILHATPALADGRPQATIRVQARVISLSGGAELRQASAELIGAQEQWQAIEETAAPADGGAPPPSERYVEDGLIRVSLLSADEAGTEGADNETPAAAAPAAPELLVEYVGN